MKKYLIIVEGESDLVFLKDLLFMRFTGLKILSPYEKNEILIGSNNAQIKILSSGGYSTLREGKINTRIKSESDQGYKLIVIQDADNPTKQDGGVGNRISYLRKIEKELNVQFEIFLFPNNQDDGDLETLLLQMVNYQKFDVYFEHYQKYSCSIKSFSIEEHSEELLQDKYKIFNYFQVYHGMEKAKEKNRSYSDDYWEFGCAYLEPLTKFLSGAIEL